MQTTTSEEAATASAPLLKISGPPGCGKSTLLAREAFRAMDEDGLPPETIRLLTLAPAQKAVLTATLRREGERRSDDAWRQISVWTFLQFSQSLWRRFGFRLADPAGAAPLCDPRVISPIAARWALYRAARQTAREDLSSFSPLRVALRQPAIAPELYALSQALEALPLTSPERRSWLNGLRQEVLSENACSEETQAFLTVTVILGRYEDWRAAQGLLTFHELLLNCERLLREDAWARDATAQENRLVMVDEAQELGATPLALLRALPSSTRLALAGAEGLCLRQTQGAMPAAFENPRLAFGSTLAITLAPAPHETVCWRDNPAFIRWSDAWLSLTLKQPAVLSLPSEILSSTSEVAASLRQNVRFGSFETLAREAQAVAARLLQEHQQGGAPWSRMMIALRQRNETDPRLQLLHEALSAHGVPYYADARADSSDSGHSATVVQRVLYEGLKTLEGWMRLRALIAEPLWEQPARMRDGLTALVLHAGRWLDFLQDRGDETSGCPSPDAEARLHEWDPDMADSPPNILWKRFEIARQERSLPHALQALLDAGAHYAASATEVGTRPLTTLCWAVLTQLGEDGTHSPLPSSPADVEAIGGFFSTLDAWEQAQEGPAGDSREDADPLCDIDAWFADAWPLASNDMEEGLGDAVRIVTPFEAQGRDADVVMIPFLTQGVFPQSAPDWPLLDEAGRERFLAGWRRASANAPPAVFEAPPARRAQTLEEEARLMALCLTRARRRLYLSTHRAAPDANGEMLSVVASPFWNPLRRTWATLVGGDDDEVWAGMQNGWNESTLSTGLFGLDATLSQDERSASAQSYWAALPKQPDELIVSGDETLTLSASGIREYQTCPRQFFYQRLLRLETPTTSVAAQGNILHELMALLNQEAPSGEYDVGRLQTLARALLDDDANADDRALRAHFCAKTQATAQRLTPVERRDVLARLLASFEDLARHGYFNHPPRRALAEQRFKFSLPGAPRCQITGVVDALLQRSDGRWDLLDYKSSNAIYCDKKASKRYQKFLEALRPPTTAEAMASPKARDYQIPLYAMAIRESADLRALLTDDQQPPVGSSAGPLLGEIGLQLARPASHAHEGSVWVGAPFAEIDDLLPDIARDIADRVCAPILSSAHLPATPGVACNLCPFTDVCDACVGALNEDDADCLAGGGQDD